MSLGISATDACLGEKVRIKHENSKEFFPPVLWGCWYDRVSKWQAVFSGSQNLAECIVNG